MLGKLFLERNDSLELLNWTPQYSVIRVHGSYIGILSLWDPTWVLSVGSVRVGALSYLYVTSAPHLVLGEACWENGYMLVLEIGPSKSLSLHPFAFPVSLGVQIGAF